MELGGGFRAEDNAGVDCNLALKVVGVDKSRPVKQSVFKVRITERQSPADKEAGGRKIYLNP
jgi:hypothetical protein